MAEKIRGALFNTLGDIEGLSFLDAFAGSGALGFEAASRGASKVTAIEKDGPTHKFIDRNTKELGLEKKVKVIRANAGGWSDNNTAKKFSIVLLDPPFDELQMNLLQKLISRHIKDNGLAVLSYPGHLSIPVFDGVKAEVDKNYGDAQLVFYRKIS
jgi:16S rRNA (guanine(966)-N(2))-methyltransferase RsmD